MVWLGHFIFCIVEKCRWLLKAAVRIRSPWSPAPQGVMTCISALCVGNALCYWKKTVTLGFSDEFLQ